MDLHGIVSGAISTVNPFVDGIIQVSTGYATPSDGKRTPAYAAPETRSCQVQPLSTGDIRQLDALNIQGVERSIYVHGAVKGLVRVDNLGGDLVTLPDGTIWLVKAVLEQWPDWCKVGVTLQNGS